MGSSKSKQQVQSSVARQLNVVMYGVNNSGKTQLMFTGLVGNDTMDNLAGSKKGNKTDRTINNTQGFNTELFVRKNDSFILWDVSGDLYHRQFWTNYLKIIPTSIVLYVVNANESTERLQEARLYLHTLMLSPTALDVQLIVVFNTTYDSKKDDNYVENPFKLRQLEEVFQLKKLPQKSWKSYEMDVRNEELVNQMFDQIANMVRKQKALTRKQNKMGEAKK